MARSRREAIAQGFNHFKVKVGISVEDDNRRLGLVRSVIDDPANFVNRKVTPTAASLEGKNAGPTGCVLMMDSNQGGSDSRYLLREGQASRDSRVQCGTLIRPSNGRRSWRTTISGSSKSRLHRELGQIFFQGGSC